MHDYKFSAARRCIVIVIAKGLLQQGDAWLLWLLQV